MKRFTLFFFAILFTHYSFSQSELPSFVKDSLDNYVNRALVEWQIPGAAVCIIKDGKVVWMKGYGVKEKGSPDKVDENTLFMIGSNTKAFTATALAMLDAERKLSLDDKVQKWLPDFKMYDPWVAKEANIRDLLCHRLGFETFQGDFMYFDSDLTTAEVREKMGKLKPLYGFRSRWGYTNCAFMTAGEIIPKVTGQSWADFITQKIFKPLGMNNSLALSKDIKTAGNKSSAHTVVLGELKKIPYGNIDNLAPAGSISSSVNDMSKWVMMQLNAGKLGENQVVPASALGQTKTPHSILGNGGHQFNRSHFSLYGLGWFMEEYAGRKIVAHTGGVNGFVTSVCMVPEEKLGIIVLTNTDANNFYEALRNEIEDAFLSLPYRNYSNVFLGYQQADEKEKAKQLKTIRDTIAMNNKTALPLTAYAGEYVHDVYGKMNIKLEDGKMIMRFEHHKGRWGTLEPLGGNRFFCTYSDPLYGMKKLEFVVDNNRVRSLTVRVADFVEFTPYEFVKKE
ncbi:MAG TPA: serine hydrolase [Chitinophagaceae bacterium]|jgi:CubicO group peptidase (beta-lactamase class C family)|nr:serine hydrolase [Chitinophagaceae bacterium]